MTKDKKVNLFNFISNVITIGVLLYLVFAKQWDFFLILSVFIIVTTLLEIVSYLRKNDIAQNTKEKQFNVTMNVSPSKEIDMERIAKHMGEQLSKEINRQSHNL